MVALSTQPTEFPSSAKLAARVQPACSYAVSHDGFIYTGSQVHSGMTTRPGPVLLLSADYAPFDLQLANGKSLRGNAIIVAPRVTRSLDARGVPLLSFNIMPSHAFFYVFSGLQRAGAMLIDRQSFEPLDDAMTALQEGASSISQATRVFHLAIQKTLQQLPSATAPTQRTREIARMLRAEPQLNPGELAQRLGRSSQLISRLFSSEMGISMRDYQSWLKQQQALELIHSDHSLTEVALIAGFSDSAQFSRAFKRWFGHSASHSRDPQLVRPITHSHAPQARG